MDSAIRLSAKGDNWNTKRPRGALGDAATDGMSIADYPQLNEIKY
jgi:hypothetical protein